jgi:nicotinate-nucleotide pyrophosphorylase (carboxylating)
MRGEPGALDPVELDALVRRALDEDLRDGPDVTTIAAVPADAMATGAVVVRAPGVVAGIDVATAVLDAAGFPSDGAVATCRDGDVVSPGTVILTLRGPLHPLLRAERTMLNFLMHLSGIATHTRAWCDALEGTGARVRDTRKTLPGLRSLEKYAVRCGGGLNHRRGLGDQALIKDNHLIATSLSSAVAAVRASFDGELEVECDTLAQVREALAAGASLVLLDNMDTDDLRAAVELARESPGVRLEASGGLSLANARAVAETGVDYLAVGALTHSSPALDIGLDLWNDHSRADT